MPLDLTCSNEEQIRVRATPVTSAGSPARLDGGIRATVVSGDGSAEQGIDELELVLKSGDDPGDTTYLIEADADLGDGVQLIQDTVVLHVTGAQAAALGLSASEPRLPAGRHAGGPRATPLIVPLPSSKCPIARYDRRVERWAPARAHGRLRSHSSCLPPRGLCFVGPRAWDA